MDLLLCLHLKINYFLLFNKLLASSYFKILISSRHKLHLHFELLVEEDFLKSIYIYMHNSSILDIEHSPYYIALGSPQTHKVI